MEEIPNRYLKPDDEIEQKFREIVVRAFTAQHENQTRLLQSLKEVALEININELLKDKCREFWAQQAVAEAEDIVSKE